MWQIQHNIDTDICTLTQSLPCCCLSCCFFFFFSLSTDRQSSVVQCSSWLVHAHGSNSPYLSFVSSQNKNSSHCHLVIIHGSGASPFETAGLSRPQIYEDATGLWTITERHGERTFLELRWRMQSVAQIYDCEECAVAMHVPQFKGTAQGKFKVLDGTDPTPSMPMLVANGNRVVYRVEELITAKGVAAPLTSDGDDWHLKVLINNENVFIRIDVCTACHECPPCWVRCLSPENVERRTTPASTTITKTRNGFEVKKSWNPEQTGAAGELRNTQMLEDVDEMMPAKSWCKVQKSIKGLNDKHRKLENWAGECHRHTPVWFRLSITENRSITEIQKRDSSIGWTSPRSPSRSESERTPQSHQKNGQSASRCRRFSTLTKLMTSLLRYNGKFRREPPKPRHPNTLRQWPASIREVETQTRTSKVKPSPNTAGQREDYGKHLPRAWQFGWRGWGCMQSRIWQDQCFSYNRFSRGQAANFQAHWLGTRNHMRQSCPGRKENRRFTRSSQRGKRRLWHKLFDDRQHATESTHNASTKEVVADDPANRNTDILSRVSQTWRNLLPQRTRRRLTIRQAVWILTSYNVRRGTEVIFVQTLVHCSFLARSWWNPQFDTSSESTLEQGDKELRIRRVSWWVDQWPRFSEDAGDVDCAHKSW